MSSDEPTGQDSADDESAVERSEQESVAIMVMADEVDRGHVVSYSDEIDLARVRCDRALFQVHVDGDVETTLDVSMVGASHRLRAFLAELESQDDGDIPDEELRWTH